MAFAEMQVIFFCRYSPNKFLSFHYENIFSDLFVPGNSNFCAGA